MEYNIRDVAGFLNLSREMIRYYEKQGVLAPRRNQENNYRSYNIFDIFLLLDTIQFKSWGINVKDMQELRQEDFLRKARTQLGTYRDQLQEELRYKQLLLERIDFIAQRAQTAYLNIGNHWLKKLPACCFIPLVQGDGDDYGPVEITKEASSALFNDRAAPFLNFCFEEENGRQAWGMMVQQHYFDALGLPELEGMRRRPEQICLYTIQDLGPVGQFNHAYARPSLEYLREKGYQSKGAPLAVLLGRGNEAGRGVRLIELYLPVELKP